MEQEKHVFMVIQSNCIYGQSLLEDHYALGSELQNTGMEAWKFDPKALIILLPYLSPSDLNSESQVQNNSPMHQNIEKIPVESFGDNKICNGKIDESFRRSCDN